jgi:hypothetical protein
MFAHWHGDYKEVNNPSIGVTVLHGSPSFSSSIKKFGTHSLKMTNTDNSTYDLLQFTRSDNYTGMAWTIEYWLYVVHPGYPLPYGSHVIRFGNNIGSNLISNGTSNSGPFNLEQWFYGIGSAGGNGYGGYVYASNRGNVQFPANTWIHFCLQRGSDGYVTAYWNGYVDRGNANQSSNLTQTFTIGNDSNHSYGSIPVEWYMDELRISNIARYSTEQSTYDPPHQLFTPATSEFTTDSNTLLLTHFNNSY